MDQIIYKKRIILILSFILVALTTLILTKYRTNLYEVNKEYLQKIAYEEAKITLKTSKFSDFGMD